MRTRPVGADRRACPPRAGPPGAVHRARPTSAVGAPGTRSRARRRRRDGREGKPADREGRTRGGTRRAGAPRLECSERRRWASSALRGDRAHARSAARRRMLATQRPQEEGARPMWKARLRARRAHCAALPRWATALDGWKHTAVGPAGEGECLGRHATPSDEPRGCRHGDLVGGQPHEELGDQGRRTRLQRHGLDYDRLGRSQVAHDLRPVSQAAHDGTGKHVPGAVG